MYIWGIYSGWKYAAVKQLLCTRIPYSLLSNFIEKIIFSLFYLFNTNYSSSVPIL